MSNSPMPLQVSSAVRLAALPSKCLIGLFMTRLLIHAARGRPIRRNPRNPTYCETGHHPISGEHLV